MPPVVLPMGRSRARACVHGRCIDKRILNHTWLGKGDGKQLFVLAIDGGLSFAMPDVNLHRFFVSVCVVQWFSIEFCLCDWGEGKTWWFCGAAFVFL
eukprot:4661215-Pyramimonas_sp.AAC.1